jgi:hypothetical protein
MDNATFVKVRTELNDECESLLLKKGADYTMNEDRLSNFKEVAALIGITPLQVWAVFTLKHFFSIMNFVKSGKLQSESIESRFQDVRNYTDLGYGLVKEAVKTDPRQPGRVTLDDIRDTDPPGKPVVRMRG